MLRGLDDSYDIAVRIEAANISEMNRDISLAELWKGAERDAEQREGKLDEQCTVRKLDNMGTLHGLGVAFSANGGCSSG